MLPIPTAGSRMKFLQAGIAAAAYLCMVRLAAMLPGVGLSVRVVDVRPGNPDMAPIPSDMKPVSQPSSSILIRQRVTSVFETASYE